MTTVWLGVSEEGVVGAAADEDMLVDDDDDDETLKDVVVVAVAAVSLDFIASGQQQCQAIPTGTGFQLSDENLLL